MKPSAMNIHKFLIVLNLFVFGSGNFVFGQWSKKCAEGGSVNCFIRSGSNLFAGTFGGVYKSIDNGENWELSNEGINKQDVRCMLVTG